MGGVLARGEEHRKIHRKVVIMRGALLESFCRPVADAPLKGGQTKLRLVHGRNGAHAHLLQTHDAMAYVCSIAPRTRQHTLQSM